MKIIIDEKNKAVIARGSVFGKRVKGVAVAHDGDEFDPDFGEELAMAKYRSNKYWVKALTYDKMIRWHNKMIADHQKEIDQLRQFYFYNYDKSCECDASIQKLLNERFKK
jgi:hypothetical protein